MRPAIQECASESADLNRPKTVEPFPKLCAVGLLCDVKGYTCPPQRVASWRTKAAAAMSARTESQNLASPTVAHCARGGFLRRRLREISVAEKLAPVEVIAIVE
mmetsp:Transcript_3285/g.10053  ORF Transcript_3285/g.10053 Transcript_3285/m.10053 type:complete len:104 (+) Transcript_3285:7427-7738(+)